MDKIDIEVKFLDRTTFEEQCKVFKEVFNDRDGLLHEYWDKKHYRNPLENSLIFGAFIDNELVGINCFQPCKYECNGITINALQSCESGVLPKCQGKGIWGKLMKYAHQYILENTSYEVLIGFPNYRNSYPGFIKMGWDTICNMNNFLMVNNTDEFIDMYFPNNNIIKLIGNLFSLQKIVINTLTIGLNNKLSIVDCQPDSFLWDYSNDDVHIEPQLEWVKWKIDYKKLLCFKVIQGNKILATFLYGINKFNGKDVICINKISFSLQTKISKKKILAFICKFLLQKYKDVAFIRTWVMPNKDENRLFKGLLFIKANHLNPFITNNLNKNRLSTMNWDVSLLDLD